MTAITIKNIFTKGSLAALVKIFLPGILVITVAGICHQIFQIPFNVYTRDPIQTLGGKPYVGIISSIGILLWCATATILFFSSVLAYNQGSPGEFVRFLLYSGAFTAFMLMDDMFLLHDVIFPEYLNISENYFYLAYGLILVTFLLLYSKILLKTDYILLILAFGFFVLSAGMDVFTAMVVELPGEYFFEDSFKLLGVISWFAFFSRTSYMQVKIAGQNRHGN
ncbi:MAG TPA: hypothetical protein VN249_04300 [Prolixibacteraceae bacterium]|nr:hypothetical protein [Prolixibacteraceae bacterium]